MKLATECVLLASVCLRAEVSQAANSHMKWGEKNERLWWLEVGGLLPFIPQAQRKRMKARLDQLGGRRRPSQCVLGRKNNRRSKTPALAQLD